MKLQIKIDGKSYEAEVEVLEDNLSQSDDAPISPGSEGDEPLSGAYSHSHCTETHSADEKQYRSPVTGLVIKVNVVAGQRLEPGDVIMLLESMKMETRIIAHHPGRVKSVTVSPGKPVKLHQVLIELE